MLDPLVDALAVYRLTKLIVDDYLTSDFREAVILASYTLTDDRADEPAADTERARGELPWADTETSEPPPKLAYLVKCPWCTSVWVAAAVVAARHLFPRQWQTMSRVLALSAVAGILSDRV